MAYFIRITLQVNCSHIKPKNAKALKVHMNFLYDAFAEFECFEDDGSE